MEDRDFIGTITTFDQIFKMYDRIKKVTLVDSSGSLEIKKYDLKDIVSKKDEFIGYKKDCKLSGFASLKLDCFGYLKIELN